VTTSRTRKTTPAAAAVEDPTTAASSTAETAKPADVPSQEPENATTPEGAAVQEQPATPVPTATPLEPPADEPDPEPEPPSRVNVADALPDRPEDGLIVDAETRLPPTDLDSVFVPATPHGTDGVATRRLLEHTRDRKHGRPMTTLLVAEGAHLSGANVSLIMRRLRAQAEAREAVRAGE
jgi:hypothetical protein